MLSINTERKLCAFMRTSVGWVTLPAMKEQPSFANPCCWKSSVNRTPLKCKRLVREVIGSRYGSPTLFSYPIHRVVPTSHRYCWTTATYIHDLGNTVK